MYYINFSLLFQAVDRVTSSQIIQNNIVDTICLYLVMESKMNNMLHIIFTLHPVDYLSLHPIHGFKRQHSIPSITHHLTRITASKDNTLSCRLPITSPKSRLQKTTLHPVDYLSPHPNHGFKRQHCILLITYLLTQITASKDNTASRWLPITSPKSRLQKTTLHPVNYLSPHPNHGFKRQHCILLITYHLTRITASKDNTPSCQLPITSPESRLQKTTLYPVDHPSPHPNHGFKRQHCILLITYHLTRITASKDNTPSCWSLSPPPNHGFKRQHSIPSITHHLTQITASKDNTASCWLPITSPESRLQKTTLHPVDHYHLPRIMASKDNTPSCWLPITSPKSRLQKTTLHPVDYLSPHPNHGFKRQHSILLITYHLTRITASKDNTASRRLPITSPESRLQKTTLHPVDYLSPHPNHGFKRQHCIPLITYLLTRITASKDNTPSCQLPITSPESRLQKTTLYPVDYPSPHPNHGFKRQHCIPSITYHLTRITASKDNTLSRRLPITSPESRLQKTTLHPVDYLSPHPNHGFKRQHSILLITYHLTRITASKDNTPSCWLPITSPESRLQKTTLHPVDYLSPHPNHGFKRQHSILSITYHLTRITASKDNTLSRRLPITSPKSRLQKTTLHPVNYLSPHPNHGFKRQHCILLITYHLTRITASKDNTPITHPRLVFSHNYKYQT